MDNYLSIDLESWAMPNIPEFLRLSSQEKKKLDRGNVKDSTNKILSILKKNNRKITFFIVGQIYDWYPGLIESIASEGHEIAYHTHAHDAISSTTSFINSINKSKKFIQRFKPVGFRAPRISLNRNLLGILKDYGFKYDSSIYGPYEKQKNKNRIAELPVTSIANIPIGSGYFIGLLKKRIEWIYRILNKKNKPVISFLHNWQILKPINPSFPTKKYVLTHPYYIPYLTDCSSTFEYLLERLMFSPMKNLIS